VAKLKLPLAIYLAGALIDETLTYLYVKLWRIYAEANPIIVLYWLDKPFWMWILKELAGAGIAVAVCLGYRRFMEFLIAKASNPRKNRMCMKIFFQFSF